VSRESVEVVLRGYRAFIDGDFASLAELLDDEIEWYGDDEDLSGFADRAETMRVLAERYREEYFIELERCIGVGDEVVVAFRASREELDENDPRPLQTRRRFTVARYSAVVTLRDGRVVRVHDYPHVNAALEAVGLDESSA
jgi:ketosteroid isomerase-like protein